MFAILTALRGHRPVSAGRTGISSKISLHFLFGPLVALVFGAAILHPFSTARAEKHEKKPPTVKAQLKLQAIQAFKNVAIKNIRATRFGFSAQLGKKDIYLSMFPIAKKKDEDADLYNVVLTERNIHLRDIVPPIEDSAAGDLKVPALVLVYAEQDNELTLAELPGPVRRAFHDVLPHGVKGKLKFTKGANLFTLFNVQNSPGLLKLQKDIGLSRYPVTLQGSISPEAMGLLANGRAKSSRRKHLKQVMLKGLDLEGRFPAIKPRGFPDAFKWDDNAFFRIQGGEFEFDGEKRNGTRVAVGTGAEIDALGSKMRFDAVFDIVRAKGLNETRLSGTTTDLPDKSFMGVKPKSLMLEGERKNKVWDIGLIGKAILHEKEIEVAVKWEKPAKSLNKKAGYAIYINDKDMTVSELVGKGDSVPGLNHIRLTDIVIRKHMTTAKLMLITRKANKEKKKKKKERETDIIFFRPAPGAKMHVAISHQTFDVNEYVPFGSAVLSEFDLKDMVMLIVPKGAANESFPTEDLPDLVADKIREVVKAQRLGGSADTVDLVQGANMFAMYDMSTSAVFNYFLKKFAMDKHVPLRGSVDPRMFRRSGGKGGKKGPGMKARLKSIVMKSLNISMPISKMRIPGLPKGMGFDLPKITLRGGGGDKDKGNKQDKSGKKKSGGSKPSIKLALEGLMNMNIGSVHLKFPGAFSISRPSGGGGGRTISFKGLSKNGWPSPAGIPWLHLKDLGLNIALTSGGSGGGGLEFGLKGLTNIGKLKNLDVDIDLKAVGGSMKAGLIKIGNKIKLADIPGFKSIPHANKFTLSNLALSTDGISGSTLFRGFPAKIGLFKTEGSSGGKRWSMGLSMGKLNLASLVPPKMGGSILKKIHMSKSALFLTEHRIDASMTDLPDFMKETFGPVLKGFGGRFSLPAGLTFAGFFEPSHKSGDAKGFGKLGLKSPIHLVGSIGGLLGGTPSIALAGKLPNIPSPPGLPKFLRLPTVVAPAFFVGATSEDVKVGFKSRFHIKAGDDNLVFDGELEIVLQPTGLAFEIAALEPKEVEETVKKNGKKVKVTKKQVWHHPFGIKGLNLRDLGLKVGVSPDSTVLVGFSGTADIGSEEVHLAAEITPALAAGGIPKSVAFDGSITHFGMDDILKLTSAVTGVKLPKGADKLPFFAIRNAHLAFATPGASDPEFGLTEQGFAMKGEFLFMEQELGSVNVVIDEVSGLKVKGEIDPLHLGPVQLRKNNLDISVGVKELPYFRFNSDIEVIGIRQRIIADFEVPTVKFKLVEKIANLSTAEFTLESVGIDLNTGKIHNPDFIIQGTFKEDFYGWLAKSMETSGKAVFDELNKAYEADLRVLHDAEKYVHKIDKKVEAARKKVRAERDREMHKVEAARHRVNSLRSKENHAHHKRKKCHWYSVGCKIKWEARFLAYKAAREVADGVLRAVEKLIDVTPIDLDPRVAGPLAERDIALAGLHAAELAVEGMEDLNKIVEKAMLAVAHGIEGHKPVVLNKASFLGGLLGVTIHDEPLMLSMDYSVFGKRLKTDFAFKLYDPKYDAKELGLIAFHAIEQLFDGAMKHVPQNVKDKVHGIMGKWIAELERVNRHEMAKHKKEFASLRGRAKTLKKKIAAADKRRTRNLAKRKTKLIDVEPDSQLFSNEMLEVGHSGHCLSIAGGGQRVEQRKCKNSDRWQRWSAVKTKNGFAQIKNRGDCLSARGNKTSDLALQLRVEACQKDSVQQWKVQSHDGDFFRVANRASQKCLHFVDPNALPGKSKAEWWPCHGADAQVFRVIANTAPVYHPVNTVIGSVQSDLCIESEKYNAMGMPGLGFRFPGRFTAKQQPCNKRNVRQRFNYVEDLEGRIKLINGEGNCFFPERRHAGSAVVSLPCERAHDQLWEKDVRKGGFALKNVRTKLCLDTSHSSLARGAGLVIAHCGTHRNQVWNFGVPRANQSWKTAKKGKLPRRAFSAAPRSEKRAKGTVYICRARTKQKRQLIGRIENGLCAVGDQERARRFSTFEVLTGVRKAKWIHDIGGDVPFDAVPAGTDGRHMLYICRTEKKGNILVGSALAGECRYAENKKTKIAATFEVLVSE